MSRNSSLAQSAHSVRQVLTAYRDYVGVCLDAFLPFTFVSPDEWHKGKPGTVDHGRLCRALARGAEQLFLSRLLDPA